MNKESVNLPVSRKNRLSVRLGGYNNVTNLIVRTSFFANITEY